MSGIFFYHESVKYRHQKVLWKFTDVRKTTGSFEVYSSPEFHMWEDHCHMICPFILPRDRILDGLWLRPTRLILVILSKILYFFEKTFFKLQMKLVWERCPWRESSISAHVSTILLCAQDKSNADWTNLKFNICFIQSRTFEIQCKGGLSSLAFILN